MNRMFVRIFLAFWLTTLAAILLSQQLGQYLEQRRSPIETLQHSHEQARRLLEHAQQRLFMLGPELWQDWLQQQAGELHWMVIYGDGQVLSNRELDPRWARIAQTISPRQRPAVRGEIDNEMILGRMLHFAGEPDFARLLIAVPKPNPLLVELLHRYLWLRLLIAMLATGIVCYWLARGYTKPVAQLRAATHKLAEGDLNTRIPLSGKTDEIALLTADFNTMVDRLQSARDQQTQLIHDVSHELRTPLARIQVALGLAQRRAGDSEELARIARECEHLNTMIDQLLASPADDRSLDDSVDLAQLLRALAEENRLEAQSQNKRIELECAMPELLIQASAAALHSALENVLRNAIRHTPPDTVVDIKLTASDNGDITIDITDKGPGVPAAELDKIFRPFYRLDQSRTRSSGGYGLGLSIAQRVVRDHGGRICAVNGAPGLTVRIVLPAALRMSGDNGFF